jgi:O-antigen ligase
MNALLTFLVIAAALYLIVHRGQPSVRWFVGCGILALPLPIYTTFFFSPHQGWVDGLTVTVSDVMMLLLLSSASARDSIADIKLLRASKYVLLFIISIALSMINSTMPRSTLMQAIMMLKLFLLYYCAPALAIRTKNDHIWAMRYVTMILGVEAILGIFQTFFNFSTYIFHSGSYRPELLVHPGGTIRASGTLDYPNLFASFLVPLFLMQLSGYFSEELRNKKTLFTILISFLAIVCSGSRNGWISLVVGIVLMFWPLVKHGVLTRRSVLGVTCLTAMISLASLGIISDRLTRSDHGSAESRVPLMLLSLRLIGAHPIIGVGGNTYANVASGYKTSELEGMFVTIVHNQYLYIFAECGLLGLLAWLGLLKALVRDARVCSTSGDRYSVLIGFGAVAALLSMMLGACFDMQKSESLIGLMFLLGGLCSGLSYKPSMSIS